MTDAPVVTLADIEHAARAIDGVASDTPLVRSRTLSEIAGAELWLKMENLQYTASFKERGAIVKLAALTAEERARGVVAASAGNHAQGVAYHATRTGVRSVIVMPKATPFGKVRNTELLGGQVVLHGGSLAEAAAHAHALAERDGLVPVHPYDDPAIIAGQGTVGLEMLRARPSLDVLVVPIGGGGLISGIATAAKALRPDIRIVGVEAALYPSMHNALLGRPVPKERPTIAEGIAVKEPGRLTLPIVRALVDEIVLASEPELEHAVQLMIEIEKTVAEGAGAAALAAVLARPDLVAGRSVGLVVSGGNIDSNLLSQVLMRGLIRAGRLVRLRCEVSDEPGSLSRVSGLIADLGGNILEVYHQRWFYDVPIKLAEIDIVLETRDARHVTDIVEALGVAGVKAEVLRATASPAETVPDIAG